MKLKSMLLAVGMSVPPISFAGGTLGTAELTPLLRQQPLLYEALLASFSLSESAFAEIRFGDSFPNLAGERAGPYTIRAKSKAGKNAIQIILCTKYEFIGSAGLPLSEEDETDAVSVKETLTHVMLQDPNASYPSCPNGSN
jgi:hypothetical protein